ncbi:MAG: PAS domain-containing protein [Acidobacteria bacterium]|nr:PAS domain-containing protein [Acidobacteriota bacterium]
MKKSAPLVRRRRPAQRRPPVRAAARPIDPRPPPIVGIGASAGGLEALEAFLSNVPAGCGIAFVIVQHLDPTRKGIMPELLQRSTAMTVVQVKEPTPVEPDCVYVIPPNKDMSVLRGVLHLLDPTAPRGQRLPIDFFFQSLAGDAGARGIGVVLSGMGTDGTLGLRAIKANAGVAFVQDPASAKFDGMPRSAVEAGVADGVAPVEDLPGMIVAHLRRAPSLATTERFAGAAAHGDLARIMILLRAETGHDFSLYKASTLNRRVERRMGLHRIERPSAYVRLLQQKPEELDLLFKELLIGVTSFFRDPTTWEELRSKVMPALMKSRQVGRTLRFWVPGCSTGQEAYSLAIVFQEVLEKIRPARRHSLQIFATDLDKDAIERARTGLYPAGIADEMSEERLRRFFVEAEQGYRVAKSIRDNVIFAPQNVIMDPPFTKLDMVSCRNLLIYLAPELQKKLLPLFHYSLNPAGLLFLGSAETIGGLGDIFEPVGTQARLYRRRESARGQPIEFPASFTRLAVPGVAPRMLPPRSDLTSAAEHLLLQQFAPAAVLVSATGDIQFVSGRTGNYLEPAAGSANWNVLSMAREGLRLPLAAAFRQAARLKEAVTIRNIRVGTNGGVQYVDLTVRAIADPAPLRGLVIVVFSDVAAPDNATRDGKARRRSPGGATRRAATAGDAERVRQELRTAREEMQTSQEELRASNEELQSTNEELQSTNEELTTSKEEMQSMNEELQTLNAELQHKVRHMSQVNSDIKNLLDSTDIATLFLDSSLRIRFFTAGSGRVFRLIQGDIGRPMTDIASDLSYPSLAGDAVEVLRTLATHEQTVEARDGRWLHVRIMPYRTLENAIDGVVMTFADVTAAKTLEVKLRATQSGMRDHIAAQDVRLQDAVEQLRTARARAPGRGVVDPAAKTATKE